MSRNMDLLWDLILMKLISLRTLGLLTLISKKIVAMVAL